MASPFVWAYATHTNERLILFSRSTIRTDRFHWTSESLRRISCSHPVKRPWPVRTRVCGNTYEAPVVRVLSPSGPEIVRDDNNGTRYTRRIRAAGGWRRNTEGTFLKNLNVSSAETVEKVVVCSHPGIVGGRVRISAGRPEIEFGDNRTAGGRVTVLSRLRTDARRSFAYVRVFRAGGSVPV